MSRLLKIENLSVHHSETGTCLLHPVSFSLMEGEVLAVVGASGSGKSLLAQAIFHILPENLQAAGKVFIRNRQLHPEDNGRKIAYIPQTVDALNPLKKIGKQIDGLMAGNNIPQRRQKLLDQLGLDKHTAEKFPFQLSGGQARRVLVAIALASDAELTVADEPTPGLDKSAKQDMMQLLAQIPLSNKGLILITHDFEAALKVADWVAVVKEGKMVEWTDRHAFSGKGEKLQHPYTKALWNALPENQFIRSL